MLIKLHALLLGRMSMNADEDIANQIDIVDEKFKWFLTLSEKSDTGD